MKKIYLFLLLAVCGILFGFTANSQSKSILFLGNSYVSSNGLPTMLKEVSNSLGSVIETETNSIGGYTLNAHSTNATSLSLISSRDWDYVVLQDQSQNPAFPPAQVAAQVYPYAAILCDSIKSNSNCTQILFFMTWGYKNGDASNCAAYPPICTYEGMQWRLRQSYVEMALDNDAWVVPCGMTVKSVRETNPEINLYSSDGSHPSIHGTYLAACTFYSSIFHKTTLGASYIPNGISASEAEVLQKAAWNVFADSLEVWNIDTTTVRANFEPLFLTKSVSAQFDNYSANADSCFWDFGDGAEQVQYPTIGNDYDIMYHTYPAEGEYNICLTAYKGCNFQKICKTRYIFISDSNKEAPEVEVSIFPNPVYDGKIYFDNNKSNKCIITDLSGRIVLNTLIIDGTADISGLSAGNYLIKIDTHVFKINIL